MVTEKRKIISVDLNADMSDFEISNLITAISSEIKEEIKKLRSEEGYVDWWDREPF